MRSKSSQVANLCGGGGTTYPIASVLVSHAYAGRNSLRLSWETVEMVRIGSVVMSVSDTGRAAEFWSRALGYASSPSNPAFLAPDSEGPRLHLDEDDRMHLDLWVASAEEQRTEVERLMSLGAELVDWEYPNDADFVVLADTEGNLFCVVNTEG